MPIRAQSAMATPAVAALNPEAGDHPVPTDPAEIAAAREASETSLREFAYYERRFGERGRRFGDSDSAWLITVCGLPRAAAVKQILWLANVLAWRGMPRYLLERHLRHLHEALARHVPERRFAYAALRSGEKALARTRRARFDEQTFIELSASFKGREVERMGEILVSAVADEADGISGAVSSIESWACDETQFSPEWMAAVRETIEAARQRCRRD